jgi:hypothetical protein
MDHRKMLNALIMEESRTHITSLDLIKSRDMLKLTLGFKATLPIDHVYTLIGLVDERHTPLFHPRFGTSDSNRVKRVMDPRTGVSDIWHALSLIAQILGAMKGQSKNRRAKAIVAAGSQTALRYIALLSRDLKIAMAKLDQMPTSFIDDPRATSMMRDWTLGLSKACPIAAETFFERSIDSTSTGPTAHTNDNLRDAVSRYADIRRRSSSIESKLAHLIRVDVIPSFSQYRTIKPTKKSNTMPSILVAVWEQRICRKICRIELRLYCV